MDDIVFWSTVDSQAHEYAAKMKKFEMSMIGALMYFLGFQVKQTFEGMFVSQSKYAKNLVKRFELGKKSHLCTQMSTSVKLGANPAEKCGSNTL